MIQILFTSPLEQFSIIPVICLKYGIVDLSITNQLIILVISLFLTLIYFSSLIKANKDVDNIKLNTKNFFLIPNRWQSIIEILYKVILSLVGDNIKHKEAVKYFPLVFFLFLFIATLNSIGLVPFSFTLTSHIIVTLAISLSVFIGINIICFKKHGIHFFALFLPPGTSIILAFLLVPIELISYIFKPVSLSIRLFANMMAGHTLLKVIAGFAFTLMSFTGVLFIIHYVPLFILVPLFALELGVALIQAFVFSILICIYLNDAINLH